MYSYMRMSGLELKSLKALEPALTETFRMKQTWSEATESFEALLGKAQCL